MADKELRKLKRRELLQMLLVQCEESERLEEELKELIAEHEAMSESYERLKQKLNVKDERLNQKDARIAELTEEIEEMKTSREIELTEAGSIAEAALRLNGIFEAAQEAADQYLMNIQRLSREKEEGEKDNRISFEKAWRAGIRRGTPAPRIRQTLKAVSGDERG